MVHLYTPLTKVPSVQMFRKGTSQVSSLTKAKAGRIGSRVLKPLTNVRPRTPVLTEAKSTIEPVYLSMIPSFKKGQWDPPADASVAVLEPSVFKHPIRRDILHLCVVHYRDGLRQGSASTKTRGEVRGSGRKIRPQKGTGKARLGDGQSPMLRGGGVAFGPKPRDFSTKLPRKVIQMGMRVALSAKLREKRLGIMFRFYWPNAKTKFLARRIEALGLSNTLFVSGESVVHEGLRRAIRNVPSVKLITTEAANVYEFLKWPRVVLDTKAVKYFECTLKKDHVPVLSPPLDETLNVPFLKEVN